ncbi:MAG: thioredoxin reductase, partial [Eubacteriales bacterium]|nr:thioredoxin reductase [Eubacteriales bacterium]
MCTNLPGLFAAGDCTGGIMQVSVAVGEGTKAALSAIDFVRKNRDVG